MLGILQQQRTVILVPRVTNVTAKVTSLVEQHLMMKTVLAHVGINNIKFQQSERLKNDVICLDRTAIFWVICIFTACHTEENQMLLVLLTWLLCILY